MVIATSHYLGAAMFERRRMTVREVVDIWRPLLERLAVFNPRLSVGFTVSPIRHLADSAHGNQLSKSSLLLAVDELVTIFNSQLSVYYFPAYEIVLDELRDYRFYGPDLAHPSPLAEEIVYERFQQVTMTPATRQQAHADVLHGAGVDQDAHGQGPDNAITCRPQENAEPDSQHNIPRHHGEGFII